MPKSVGLFDSFDNLDQISLEAVACWLKPIPPLVQLENYLANKILYPQTIPQTELGMQIDLAILREALKINGPKPLLKNNALLGDNPFLNTTLRKVLIPGEFTNFIQDLTSLTGAFIDALLLGRAKKDCYEDLWTLILTDDVDEVIGSIILPQFEKGGGLMNLKLFRKNYVVKQGDVTVIPCLKDRVEIAYKLQNGHFLGKTENAVEVYGGKLGLVVDGRSA